MERNTYGKIVEDVGLAIQKLDEIGLTRDAEIVRLVSMHHMFRLACQVEFAGSPATRMTIVYAAMLVLSEQNKKKPPLFSLGQGDYRQDYYPDEELAPAKPRRGLNAFRSFIWRGQR